MADSSDMIMEERVELMVSPTGGQPTLRTAHFLKPSIDKPLPVLPHQITAAGGCRKPPLKVTFRGWRSSPLKDWGKWVENMRSSHESAWKKAGIYEAVMNSTYVIHRNDDVILNLARIWSPETKTFVFPWGEATLTLEDMIFLGGFSVLGNSVDPDLTPLGDKKLLEIKSKLLKARSEIHKSAAKKCTHSSWISKFIDSECEVEHEAFLVLWLERFAFPNSAYDTVGSKLFDIAIRLARGRKIALAPAVLASIYKNLTLMKEALVEKSKYCVGKITISAPFQLVQVWAWERFPALRPNGPNPNSVGHDKPRFARWDELKMEVENVGLAIDSAGDDFWWRPYTFCAKRSQLYKENECWVSVNGGLDDELEALVRCLRVSELVGVENCIEQYLPHRVAMQFGMDQDVPGHVARANKSSETAWEFYTRPVLDVKLYVPPRLFESDVTIRYLRWWEDSAPKRAGVKRKSCKISNRKVAKLSSISEDPMEMDDNITLAELVKKQKIVDGNVKLCNPVENTELASNRGKTSIRIEPGNRCSEKSERSKDLSGNSHNSFDRSNDRDCTLGTSAGTSQVSWMELKERIGNLEKKGVELEERISNVEKWVAFNRRKI